MDLTVDANQPSFKERVLFFIKLITAIFVVGYLFFESFKLILMVFTAILIAIFFRGIGEFFSSKTRLKPIWGTGLAVVLVFGVLTGFGFVAAPQIAEQTEQLTASFGPALQKVKDFLSQHTWGQKIIDNVNQGNVLGGGGAQGAITKATGAISGFMNGLLEAFIILFIGLYLSFAPQTYKTGVVKLFPKNRRARIHDVMDKISHTLKWWLIGRFIDMTFIGVLIFLGLTFLGIPMALTLALIAGLTNFIPNIGPILGSIPAIIVGLGYDPTLVIYIVILYTIVQSLESVLITPMVQQKAIHLPPALTLTSMVLLGTAYGTIGLLIATPLVAAVIVVVKELYVKDVLHDESV